MFLTVSSTTDTSTFEVSNGDTISVIVTDSNGCQTSDSLTIIASDSPLNLDYLQCSRNVICSGDEIVITASGGDAYQFFINETPPAPGEAVGNVLTTSSLTESSTVRVVASNALGCTESATINVRVLSITDPGTIGLSVATDTTVCFGNEPAGVITSLLTLHLVMIFIINGNQDQLQEHGLIFPMPIHQHMIQCIKYNYKF